MPDVPVDRNLPGEQLRRAFENLKKQFNENTKTFPNNILLVGLPAAGKSSLVNLFRSAFKGEYSEVALPGSLGLGEEDAVTQHLHYFHRMGLDEEEFKRFKESHQFDDTFKLPCLIDMPGINRCQGGDVEVDHETIQRRYKTNIENLLKYVIDGLVPDEFEVSSILSGDKKVSRTNIKAESDRLKIDRVVFVVSVTQDIDQEMLKSVVDIITGSNGKRKVIPYIVLFTHTDLVGEDKISPETAQGRKESAASILKFSKNLRLNSHDIVNYNDNDPVDEDEDHRYQTDLMKHTQAIKALNKLCTRRRIVDNKPSVTRTDELVDTLTNVQANAEIVYATGRSWCYQLLKSLFFYVIIFGTIYFIGQHFLIHGTSKIDSIGRPLLRALKEVLGALNEMLSHIISV